MVLKRTQHPDYGREIRALLGGSKLDQEIAGIINSEADDLLDHRNRGGSHPSEDRLHGDDLREIHELCLYNKSQSIRLYFVVRGQELVMLALDKGKRRTKLSDGMKQTLLRRLREIRSA